MKSTLIEAEVKKPEIEFPCLIKACNRGLVFLCLSKTEATCIFAGPKESYWKIGMQVHSVDIGIDSRYAWEMLPPGTKVEITV
jgi:hypothetical protein